MKFITKLINTVKVAHSSRMMIKKELTEIQQDRLNICKGCEFNSDNVKKLTFKNKIFKLLNKIFNKFYRLKITVNAICTLCGCDLSVMSSVYEEKTECKLGKWKQ